MVCPFRGVHHKIGGVIKDIDCVYYGALVGVLKATENNVSTFDIFVSGIFDHRLLFHKHEIPNVFFGQLCVGSMWETKNLRIPCEVTAIYKRGDVLWVESVGCQSGCTLVESVDSFLREYVRSKREV